MVFIAATSWKNIEKVLLIKVVIIVTTSFLFSHLETDRKEYNFINRMSDLQDREKLIMHRGATWLPAWQIIKTAPVIGTGIGTYYIVLPPFRHVEDGDPGYFVHNDFLQFWVETGFVGLSLILLIMIATGRFYIRVLRHKKLKPQDKLETIGLMAGLIAVSIHSFVDFNFYIIAILMIMGFMCARIQEISGQYYSELKRSFIPKNYLSKKLYMLTAGILPVILLNYCLPVAIADYHWKKAKEQIKNGQIKNGELTLKLAAEWNPNNIRVHFQQFLLYKDALRNAKNHALESERKVLFANSLLILNKIENINTLAAIVPESRGHLLIENTDIVIENWEEKALFEFKRALYLDPRLYRARMALAKIFVHRSELKKAILLMNDGVQYYYPTYLTGLDKFYKYAIKLNLMNGDTIKAKEIQIDLKWVEVNNKSFSPKE